MVRSPWTQPGKQTRICVSTSPFFQLLKTYRYLTDLKKERETQKKPARRRQPRHKKVGAAERCTATSTCLLGTQVKNKKKTTNAIWNKRTTGRRTRWPQINEIFCLIISTACPVFLYFLYLFFFNVFVQMCDWQRQQQTSGVSAVRGFVAAGRGGKKALRSAGNTRLKQI